MSAIRLDRGAAFHYGGTPLEMLDDGPGFIRYVWAVENDVRVYIEIPKNRLFDEEFQNGVKAVVIETRGDFSPLAAPFSSRPKSWAADDKWSDFLTYLFQEPQMNISELYLGIARAKVPLFELLPKIKYEPSKNMP